MDDIVRHSLSIAREIKYDNVGTWEWIVTPKGEPFSWKSTRASRWRTEFRPPSPASKASRAST